MKYLLHAATIWEQGPRAKQEDSIFPAHEQVKDTDRLFVLCDGMGGHAAGEVASRTVCEALSRTIFDRCPDAEGAFTDDDFAAALAAAYDALDTKDNGEAKKMGTTLTLLKLHDRGCTIAHIGDSRVYHIRPGQGVDDTQILFQTEDHSLVNDLVKIGELTREEAKVSRQKNVITRAMQPCMERRSRADLYHTHDIRPGDWFMLCSDGILEQLEEENIRYIFSAKGGDLAKKIAMLVRVTEENHDNHSAILVQITDVLGAIPAVVPEPAAAAAAAPAQARPQQPKPAHPETLREPKPQPDAGKPADARSLSPLWWILCALLVALLAFGGVYAYRCWKSLHDAPQPPKPETELPAGSHDLPSQQQHPAQPVQPQQPAAVHLATPQEAVHEAAPALQTAPAPQASPAPQATASQIPAAAAAALQQQAGRNAEAEGVVSSDTQLAADAANAVRTAESGQNEEN